MAQELLLVAEPSVVGFAEEFAGKVLERFVILANIMLWYHKGFAYCIQSLVLVLRPAFAASPTFVSYHCLASASKHRWMLCGSTLSVRSEVKLKTSWTSGSKAMLRMVFLTSGANLGESCWRSCWNCSS